MSTDNGRISTGPAAWDDVHPQIASVMLTTIHAEAPGLYGRWLAIAHTGRDPAAPTAAQRRAAPDTADPAALDGGGSGA